MKSLLFATSFLFVSILGSFAICSDICEKTLESAALNNSKKEREKRPLYRIKPLWDLQKQIQDVEAQMGIIKYRLNPPDRQESLWEIWSYDDEPAEAEILSPKEKEALEVRLKQLEEIRDSLIVKAIPFVEKNKKILLDYINKQMNDSQQAPLIKEYIQYLQVKSLRHKPFVSVLVGSQLVPPTEKELAEYSTLVQGLLSKGYNIVYDADSHVAPLIAKLTGPLGLGISGGSALINENLLTFKNPFLRLEALAGRKTIVGPESLVGMAVAINDQADLIFDPNKKFGNSLARWKNGLDGSKDNLGLSYSKVFIGRTADRILSAKKGFENVNDRITLNLSGFGSINERFSLEKLEEILNYRDSVINGEKALRDVRGAVVYGSSSLVPVNVDTIYGIGYALGSQGIPVVTGGAGGAMLAANMGAYDAGGESIGIPIMGRSQLGAETKTYSNVQTKTIPTSSYSSRIPLLMQNRDLVIVVPGGNGTMREVATAMIQHASNPDLPWQMIFVGQNYFSGLKNAFANMDLPASFLKRIQFVSLIEALPALQLKGTNASQPRSNRKEFPKKEFFK